MRILFPVQVFFPSQAGGPANSVYWLAKHLRGEGFETIVVASDDGLGSGIARNRWSESDAGRVIYIRTRRVNFPLRQTLAALRQIFRADVVHLSSVFYPAAFVTAIAARLLGRRILWSPRGELDEQALVYSPRRKRLVLAIVRLAVGRTPLFHTTSGAESERVRKVFGAGARIAEIPNFIEMPPVSPPATGRYLLYIGRLHPKKAVGNLIRALSESHLFRSGDAVLRIAGKGSPAYRAELVSLASELGLADRVEFLGQVEGAAKESLFAGAIACVMPSHTENFGNVVLESLSQGTPVIASRGTPWESLESAGVGLWTENSPSALASAIDTMLALGETDLGEMRRRARPFVEEHFDIASNIDRWSATYKSL